MYIVVKIADYETEARELLPEMRDAEHLSIKGGGYVLDGEIVQISVNYPS